MVEMTVRYQVSADTVESVTGEFAGVELGPIPGLFLPLRIKTRKRLKKADSWLFIAFGSIVDITCADLPEAFVVPVQHMLETVEMHRSDYENEMKRRREVGTKPPQNDANWGHG